MGTRDENELQEERQLHEIFESIDENKDGVLSEDEVKDALERMQIPATDKQVEKIFKLANAGKEEVITFQEFKIYVSKQVKALRATFDAIDKDHNGTLEPMEVQESIEQMYHVKLTMESVNTLMSKIGSNPGHITFHEFKHFLMMLPIHCQEDNTRMQHVFDYWKDVASVDFGEGAMNMMNVTERGVMSSFMLLRGAYASLVAGGVAGIVSRTCTAPLDRVKTIMQLQTKMDAKYTGVLSGLQNIWHEGGIRGFFQGNGLNCVKIFPESAAKFFVYENLKQLIADGTPTQELTIGQRFLAGSAAGAFSQFLVYPVDCLKTRMAAAPLPVPFSQMVATTYHNGGSLAFYRGMLPSVMGMVPYAGIDLALYETFKKIYNEHHFKKQIHHLGSEKLETPLKPATGTIIAPLVCGTLSSTIAQLISYPLSLVRTRMQAQGSCTALGYSATRYTGMWDVLSKTVKNEGLAGLYKGIGPNYLKVIPSVSISYLVYENVKTYLCK
eukprot:Phypoly_transcript_01857.p1 GENE.Phypoly_transcript_01857~~Phypoly_transcript_01857.p1  ORF type:complete len:498 (+),score=68.14 Phypoly_transcript_01857:112-1605(+)